MPSIDAVPEGEGLYVSRKKIYPKDVSGPFRRFKWAMLIVTLAIYYVTPWIRWSRGPDMPDQAVLIDLVNTRFYFFFIEIWPQEFYYVAGLLIMAGLGLFLVTSVVGRAWCGYACPQTVWTDLYLWVERRLEGDRNRQIRLDKAPWTLSKVSIRVIKHAIFLVIAVATGGAWVFYFADAPTLAMDLLTGQAAFAAYAAIGVLTFTTYALGGLMREQVCTYMCPWPRIQGAMLDEKSLVVTYNDWRGEPRGKHRKTALEPDAPPLGDCIDCDACVAVCPMGIDIRNGQQLECITCALCIDACDGVMEKLGKPKGLIAYSTLERYEACCSSGGCGTQKSLQPSLQVTPGSMFKTRAVLYFGLWAAVGVALTVALLTRDSLDANIRHDRNPQFVTLSDGSIRNGYQIKILNKRLEPRRFQISVEGAPRALLRRAGSKEPAAPTISVLAPADDVLDFRLLVERPRIAINESFRRFKFRVVDTARGEEGRYAASFHAPSSFDAGP